MLDSTLLLLSLASLLGAADLAPADSTPASIGARLRSLPPAMTPAAPVRLERVVVGEDTVVDLQLRPYAIVTPRTSFVLGGAGGDRPLAYDRSRMRVLRGAVAGNPGSHVFIAAGPNSTVGVVDVGGARHWIGEGDSSTLVGPVAPPPAVPRCGIDGSHDHATCGHTSDDGAELHGAVAGLPPAPPVVRVVQLAIETDYELFSLFGDAGATADHVTQVYAAVSDILERDVGVRLELTFVRIWDTPADLFNEPDPLQPFRNHWNSQMGFVQRDVAQFLSGRRDLPWGGIAYLSALCGNFAYSIVGYALGRIPDLDAPSIYHFDVPVTAHELGHNLGTNHTHFYGLDDCDQLDNTPQRGTIMSYCSQTVSGGNAMTDLLFDTVCVGAMQAYLVDVECIHADCDEDGMDDAQQILAAPALDSNGNGVLDSCEDCDEDGVLDAEAIAAGTVPDLDGNGVPDSCQPDCNGNGVPDVLDIALGDSVDLWLDSVPDECEADCDGNGQSDYSQIQANLSLDLDRDTILDGCEDCDGDGIIDLVARDGAWDAWVANTYKDGAVRAMHAVTGSLALTSTAGAVSSGNDLVITPDRRVLVSSSDDDRIVEFAADGSLVGDLVPSGLGGLNSPAGMLIHDGSLLVASTGSNAVLRYSLASGAFLGAFVPSGSGGLTAPFGLARGADGHLYVNGADNRVRRYDGTTGAFLGVFVTTFANGGLSDPRGMLFLPDGRLVIAGRLNNAILSYNGATGAPLGPFNKGGTTNALTFDEPWGLRIGPNGNLYAVRHDPGEPTGTAGGLLHDDLAELHVNSSRIYEFDIQSGIFLRSYVTGHDTGLWGPTGFDFMPGEQSDCNRNGEPDSCDILRGRSADLNGNGVPDECDGFSPDLDGNGTVDGGDLGVLLAAWGECPKVGPCPADLNSDGVVDGADLGIILASWG